MGNGNSGRGGLPREKRREIERRIRAGQRNSQIARECGIDVSTVSRYKRRLRDEDAGVVDADDDAHDKEAVRCGTCGGLVKTDYCIRCFQEKTIFAPARARRTSAKKRRSQKARFAA
jgi:hypothetical protein